MVAQQIMAAIPDAPADTGNADIYGNRLTVILPITGPNGNTVDVETGWMYDAVSGGLNMRPRILTAMVAKRKKGVGNV